jgi:hypothetical protein
MYLILDLTGCARNLIDYLADTMDPQNVVSSNKLTRARFISFVNHISRGKIRYTDGTVRQAFVQLKNKGRLLDAGRGAFVVNPIFFTKSKANSRLGMIKVTLSCTPEGDQLMIERQLETFGSGNVTVLRIPRNVGNQRRLSQYVSSKKKDEE